MHRWSEARKGRERERDRNDSQNQPGNPKQTNINQYSNAVKEDEEIEDVEGQSLPHRYDHSTLKRELM